VRRGAASLYEVSLARRGAATTWWSSRAVVVAGRAEGEGGSGAGEHPAAAVCRATDERRKSARALALAPPSAEAFGKCFYETFARTISIAASGTESIVARTMAYDLRAPKASLWSDPH